MYYIFREGVKNGQTSIYEILNYYELILKKKDLFIQL